MNILKMRELFKTNRLFAEEAWKIAHGVGGRRFMEEIKPVESNLYTRLIKRKRGLALSADDALGGHGRQLAGGGMSTRTEQNDQEHRRAMPVQPVLTTAVAAEAGIDR